MSLTGGLCPVVVPGKDVLKAVAGVGKSGKGALKLLAGVPDRLDGAKVSGLP
jgi:hypothetical protein